MQNILTKINGMGQEMQVSSGKDEEEIKISNQEKMKSPIKLHDSGYLESKKVSMGMHIDEI